MSHFKGFIVIACLFSFLSLSNRQAEARLVSTEQMLQQVSIDQKKQQIAAFLQRQDIEKQFLQLGLSAKEAQSRLHALTDDEVLRITERLDQLPAGQDGFGTVLGFVLIIFIILLVTDILHLTKVFPFTR